MQGGLKKWSGSVKRVLCLGAVPRGAWVRLNWKQRPSTVPTAPRMPGTSQASQGLDTSFRTTLTLGPLSAERGRYLVKSWEVRSARGSCWLLQADLLGRLRGASRAGPGAGLQGCDHLHRAPLLPLESSAQILPHLPACGPWKQRQVPSRWIPEPRGSLLPAQRGGVQWAEWWEASPDGLPHPRAVCILTQALTHTFPVSLPRPTAKPVFSGQPQPKKREWTCS